MIDLLLGISALPAESKVLDVGCGIGGTTRYLAKSLGCDVTGITISGQQVKIARDLTAKEVASEVDPFVVEESAKIGEGSVRFIELDAEKMADFFPEEVAFDCVWISEAMSHLPDKELFFRNAEKFLKPDGKLVIADWFKDADLTDAQINADIRPIEGEVQSINILTKLLMIVKMECCSLV